jgi:tRNA U34 5-carboxymethylaminomethyl modifying GTPase MnmE/TrmE
VLFCVDINKNDWQDDYRLWQTLPLPETLLVATQIDRFRGDREPALRQLKTLWGLAAVPVSAHTGENLEGLRHAIDACLGASSSPAGDDLLVTLSARQRESIRASIETLNQAVEALRDDLAEVAAMLLRTAYQHLGETAQHVGEEILGHIFGRFCIGK